MGKKTLIFDFDGVIHSYISEWKGADVIPDLPVPGIREAIASLRARDYEVVVLSTRCSQPGGIEAIKKYLIHHGIIVDAVIRDKVPAILTVDDRCICFDGDAVNLVSSIFNFKTWMEK